MNSITGRFQNQFRIALCGVLAVGLVAVSACGGMESAGEGGAMIAIVGAQLQTSLDAEIIPFSVVVVADGKIEAAGPQADVPVPKDAETVQGAGMLILPLPYNATIEAGQPANLQLQDAETGAPRGIMTDGEWVE